MVFTKENSEQLAADGYTIIEDVFNAEETETIIRRLTSFQSGHKEEPYAIRQVMTTFSELADLVFTPAFRSLLFGAAAKNYFLVKSIYFDKPADANWFVSLHQDLSIAVKEKQETAGFGGWIPKPGHYTVQPPIAILESQLTLRIHLDDTRAANGALQVVPGSHRHGITRPEKYTAASRVFCAVPAGGVMLMRPLLQHASGRTTNGQRRRVLHLEFNNVELAKPLQWAEEIRIARSASV